MGCRAVRDYGTTRFSIGFDGTQGEPLLKVNLSDPGWPAVPEGERMALEAQFGVREPWDLVERLMGKKPESRFQYIQENARFVEELDV